MKNLYDQELFSDEFLIKWFNKKLKLDKNSIMYDRKSEKKFRELITSFINWLE